MRDGPEKVLLVACLTADGIPGTPSVVRRCARCWEEKQQRVDLWVARDMARRVDDGTALPLCFPCVGGAAGSQPGLRFGIAQEQIDTLAEAGVLPFSLDLIDRINAARDLGE